MGEIKITVSEKLDALIQKKADSVGIKKTELVKNYIVEKFLEEDNEKN